MSVQALIRVGNAIRSLRLFYLVRPRIFSFWIVIGNATLRRSVCGTVVRQFAIK